MEPKEYEISTIQDIFNVVTTENIDRFMLDFYAIFDKNAQIKELCTEEQWKDLSVKSFIWKDDGKHKIDIILSPRDEKPT